MIVTDLDVEMPPPLLAVLPEMVLLVIVTVPKLSPTSLLSMPPPLKLAVLPEMCCGHYPRHYHSIC
jgi:hypothetical protein